eukprot:TRINITY_DN2985_c0_g1_i1.p1 TRINITY_DN2985_c0_g1~~TRINITY_DN2985_c0_g1_i1.p1  ORF type:complete len:147 (-),score=53.56 TRINITY_DN2985_c0_g1_i1:60-500(-)
MSLFTRGIQLLKHASIKPSSFTNTTRLLAAPHCHTLQNTLSLPNTQYNVQHMRYYSVRRKKNDDDDDDGEAQELNINPSTTEVVKMSKEELDAIKKQRKEKSKEREMMKKEIRSEQIKHHQTEKKEKKQHTAAQKRTRFDDHEDNE